MCGLYAKLSSKVDGSNVEKSHADIDRNQSRKNQQSWSGLNPWIGPIQFLIFQNQQMSTGSEKWSKNQIDRTMHSPTLTKCI